MAKFVFSFDGVLRQREHVETLRQRELATIEREMTRLRAEARELNESMQGPTENLRTNHLTGRLDLNVLAAHRRFIVAVKRKSAGVAERIAGAQKQLDLTRDALAEAAKQRKIIEKLREKILQRWTADVARKGTTEADEVAMQIDYRNSMEEKSRTAGTRSSTNIIADRDSDGAIRRFGMLTTFRESCV